jgi:hypothetical protein
MMEFGIFETIHATFVRDEIWNFESCKLHGRRSLGDLATRAGKEQGLIAVFTPLDVPV